MLSRASGRRVARMAPPWFSCLQRAMVTSTIATTTTTTTTTSTIGTPFFVRDSSRPVSRRQLSSLPSSPNQDQDHDSNTNKSNNNNNNNNNDSLPITATTPTKIDDDYDYEYDYDDIDFAVSARIEGEESQIATITLRPGERLRAESGSMIFMTEGVTMKTTLAPSGSGGGGGSSSLASSAISRVATGQNLFLTDFWYNNNNDQDNDNDGDGNHNGNHKDKSNSNSNSNTRTKGSGTVALGTDFPSKILKLSLGDHGGSLVAQKGAFLASSNPSVTIEMEFTRTMTAGFFGGQGFVLQRLVGNGTVLVKAGGALFTRELSEGEVLRVTSGSIVAFEPTVLYDVQTMPGIRNAMFGGEGLFVTTLTGPGRIWLQGLPPDRAIAAIASRVPGAGSGGIGIGPVIPIGGGYGDSGDSDSDSGDSGVDGGPPPVDPGVLIDTEGNAANVNAPGAEDSEGFGTDSDSMVSSSSSSSSSSYSNAPGEASESAQETTYTDGDGGTADELLFDDNDNYNYNYNNDDGYFDNPQQQQQQQQHSSETAFFEDDDATEIFDNYSSGAGADVDVDVAADADAAEEASEAGSSLLSTLWDIFMGD